MLLVPITNGLAFGLSIFFLASGINTLLVEWQLEGSFMRFILLVTVPLLFAVSPGAVY
ncbi:hypothetical protein BDW22DRAFT_715096 [Trametopsis cervina]|nr:hypothetical protein BDW22DRAFT_715096 [Trametopsis cervina]